MGIVFGMTGSAEPSYNVLRQITSTTSTGVGCMYEIRHYSQFFTAEVPMSSYNDNGDSFRLLAKYIGVFGNPENEKRVPMAMTAPVITQPMKMAMTSPVITSSSSSSSSESMSFVLPFEFNDMSEIPKPNDKRITIKHIPKRVLSCYRYSGSFDPTIANTHVNDMITSLKKEKLVADNANMNNVKWEISQYHPPFTLPFMRRNEVWLILDHDNNDVIKELIKKQ